jgi:hypothetical protein
MNQHRDPAADVTRPTSDEDRADEHDRIRSSNDRDQQMERQGEVSAHNRGYDAVVKGNTDGIDTVPRDPDPGAESDSPGMTASDDDRIKD